MSKQDYPATLNIRLFDMTLEPDDGFEIREGVFRSAFTFENVTKDFAPNRVFIRASSESKLHEYTMRIIGLLNDGWVRKKTPPGQRPIKNEPHPCVVRRVNEVRSLARRRIQILT